MSDKKRRRPAPNRARKRAIRAHAAQAGVPYSVAARHLDDGGLEASADQGRTIYPASSDEHRWWLIAMRENRAYDLRVRDTQRAVQLPLGRAEHVVERFPSTRGEPGTGVGPLYHGESRWAVIAMLFAVAGHERPDQVPAADELAWLADLGEESAVDIAVAGLDRSARAVLDLERWTMWTRIEAALSAGEHGTDRRRREAARELGREFRGLAVRSSVDGARHTLDALLVATDHGHAPGTRVRIRTRPYRGQLGTIVGARWGAAGPPVAYEVRPDGGATTLVTAPDTLTLPADHDLGVMVAPG